MRFATNGALCIISVVPNTHWGEPLCFHLNLCALFCPLWHLQIACKRKKGWVNIKVCWKQQVEKISEPEKNMGLNEMMSKWPEEKKRRRSSQNDNRGWAKIAWCASWPPCHLERGSEGGKGGLALGEGGRGPEERWLNGGDGASVVLQHDHLQARYYHLILGLHLITLPPHLYLSSSVWGQCWMFNWTTLSWDCYGKHVFVHF